MNKVKNSILGLIVGDALGVPVEFISRGKLDINPVTDMREFGTHNQPRGTWSDDTSLTLATMDGIIRGDNDIEILNKFCNWFYKDAYTAHNEVFDIGNTTASALRKFKNTGEYGLTDDSSNGNGSLMRILPIALANVKSDVDTIIKMGRNGSSLTHAHITSKLCCAYYCLVVSNLYNGINIEDSFNMADVEIKSRFANLTELEGVFTAGTKSRSEIQSSGYVVHGLEVARWCMITSNDYSEAVLKAINLGDDTDTNGAIVGGLAGLYYGNIPETWVTDLVRKDWIIGFINKFELKLSTDSLL